MAIILLDGSINWKGDPVSGAGRVSLYDQLGNPQRSKARGGAHELGVNIYEDAPVTMNVLAQNNAQPLSEYVSSAIAMTGEGYNTLNLVVQASGTGGLAIAFALEGSFDGTSFLGEPLGEFYAISPQNSQMKEAFIELRTVMPFVRVRALTEVVCPAGTSITVHGIRSTSHSTEGGNAMSAWGGGVFSSKYPEARGAYTTNFYELGVATANYVYLALFNPSDAIAYLDIDNFGISSKYLGNARNNPNFRIDVNRITSATGGVANPIAKMRAKYPAPIATTLKGNPVVTVTDNLFSYGLSMTNNAPFDYTEYFRGEELSIGLNPGEGLAFSCPVALSTSDEIGIHIQWRGEI